MKMQTLGWLIGLSAIASSFISCSQPQVVCVAAHGGTPGANQDGTPTGIGHAATFTLKGAAPACAATIAYPTSTLYPSNYPDGAKLDNVRGDIIGFETYHPSETTENGPEPDFTKGNVALQSDGFFALVKSKRAKKAEDTAAEHKGYAYGEWQSVTPDEDGICEVSNLKPAEQDIPKVDAIPPDPMKMGDMGKPEEPPISIKYEWKDLKVYSTAAAQGTQFSANLTYTRDSCTVDYHVLGVWPVVGCDSYGTTNDEMGNVITDKFDEPIVDHLGVPDDALCCPNADPDAGRITGSGINPDFPVKCDPVLLVCVLDVDGEKNVPVLSPGWDQKSSICKPKGPSKPQ